MYLLLCHFVYDIIQLKIVGLRIFTSKKIDITKGVLSLDKKVFDLLFRGITKGNNTQASDRFLAIVEQVAIITTIVT